MRVVFAQRAILQIESQFSHGLETFGPATATKTIRRLRIFIDDMLAQFPRSGTWSAKHELYEAWVPQTPFVVLYRFDAPADTLTVLAVFHHAEDRKAWDFNEEED